MAACEPLDPDRRSAFIETVAAHDLQPRRRRRFVATTDSNHDGPIFPDLARDRAVDGPYQLWVADITYIAIATGAGCTPRSAI
jgi:transposase InsO family protein